MRIAHERRDVDDATGERGDVDRYEQLREGALTGAAGSSRLGLALLQHRGVTAWTRAWHSTTPAAHVSAPPAAPVGEPEIVCVLASMALACAGAA